MLLKADEISTSVALVTLGGQAQVVTFALDALLSAGYPVSRLLVLHMAPHEPRVRRALSQLTAEFAGDRYIGQPLQFRHMPVLASGQPLIAGRPLVAIANEQEAVGAWAFGRDLLAGLKHEGAQVHLCLAGGPRILALTLISAAALYCDHQDRLWHLYTPPNFLVQARDGAILHAPADAGVTLVPVPLVPWGAYLPGLRALVAPGTAPALAPADAAACNAVWLRLTARQRDVVRVLAHGMLPQEAADALGISLKTLDTHKTQILAECRIAWKLADDAHLTYHFLRETFGPWLRDIAP